MLKEILFTVYAALIPAVPLWGIKHFKKTDKPAKRDVCRILFVLQSFVSLGCILTRLGYV